MPGMPDPEMLAQLRAALDGQQGPQMQAKPMPLPGGDMAAPPSAGGEVPPQAMPPAPMGGGITPDPGGMDGGPPMGGQSPQRQALARMLMMQSRGAR